MRRKVFRDRAEAGRALGEVLAEYKSSDCVVLGLPRGGVAVAVEVARALGCPLDVTVVRKVGAPWQPELGIGAVGPGGVLVYNRDLLARLGLEPDALEELADRERAIVAERMERYHRGRPQAEVRGRSVIVVDDGIATGGTARAAARVIRDQGPEEVVLAVPVCPPEAVAALDDWFDRVVTLSTPSPFLAVGEHYSDFHQVSDDEVLAMLDELAG